MRRCTHLLHAAFAACAAAAPAAAHACWEEAERLYGVSAHLLYAIARAESSLNPSAVNLSHRARTGTYDIGLMQINSSHLPELAAFGISERDLYDSCTNIKVGAWLMAQSFRRFGVSWDAVGAYNAACSELKGPACAQARSRYAWRVFGFLSGAAEAPRHPRMPAAPRNSAAPIILAARVTP